MRSAPVSVILTSIHEALSERQRSPEMQVREGSVEMSVHKAAFPLSSVSFLCGQALSAACTVPVVKLMGGDFFPGSKQHGVFFRVKCQIAEALQSSGSIALAIQHPAHRPSLSVCSLHVPLEVEESSTFSDGRYTTENRPANLISHRPVCSKLSCMEFLFEGVIASAGMLIFERPDPASLIPAFTAILSPFMPAAY